MARPTRVLHVIPSVAPVRGGPSAAVRTMTRGLARAGLDVHVATTDDGGPDRLSMPLDVPVVRDGVTYWYFRRQARAYTLSWPLFGWLGRHLAGYDLVHAHALFSWAPTAAAYWADRARVPYIVRPLGTLGRWGMRHRRRWLKRLSFRLLERRIVARAARVHYTSEQERLEAAELGVTGGGSVVPLGTDLGAFERLPPRGWLAERAPHLAGRPVVLFMSRIDPKKGLDLVIGALSALGRGDVKVVLVVAGTGTPECEAALRREAARRGVAGDIVWTGFLEGREKLAALADADLFVLPSYSENFGLAVVEAMACGVPVVISDRVGIHREVVAAGAGRVVPCEATALAGAIDRMVKDPNSKARHGARGRRLVRERFSMDAMTAGLIRMYECVRRREPGRCGADGRHHE